MRRVKYFEYEKTKEPEKYHMDKVDKGEANFIQYGVSYEEFESGPGNYTTAVLELDDGTVKNIPCEYITFINKG